MEQNPYYERGLRKILTTPTEVRAIPTTEETTMTHIGGQAKVEAASAARSAGREFRRKRLADIIGFRKKELDVQKEQGRTAAKIGIANLALQGVGGYQQLQEAEKQSAIFGEIANLKKELLLLMKRHYAEMKDSY